MRIEHSITIAAPPERVWQLTVDVESWPDITPTITSVERLDDGALAVGSRARIKQPAQRARVWSVTTIDPERSFAWSTKALGSTMTGRHELTPTEGGTTNRLIIDVEGPTAPLVGRLLRRPLLRTISTENDGFKKAAEQP